MNSIMMHYLRPVTFLISGLVFACCATPKAQTTLAQPVPAPVATTQAPAATWVQWDKNLLDLGSVKKGEKRPMVFEFTNTSGGDLKIYHVDACECTTVDFPRGIIPAGEKRRLDAVFDSEKKDESETITINVFFENPKAPNEAPHLEEVRYKFELVKG